MLVSAIMPTRGRPALARDALSSFRRQTWPWRELIIVDDWDHRSFNDPPAAPGVHYYLLEHRASVGAKRNIAIGHSRGDVIVHWDDDDMSNPARIANQVDLLTQRPEVEVVGYSGVQFTDGRDLWLYRSPDHLFALGTSLMYRRTWWEGHPFPDLPIGEDTVFLGQARGRIAVAECSGMMFCRIHGGNTSTKLPVGSEWVRIAE